MENYTIRDIPEHDRPYERCLREGTAALTDTELLAVILRTGARGMSALKMAEQILKLCPHEPGLGGLHHMTAEELKQLRGIGTVKAVQVLCIGELARRMARNPRREGKPFRNAETVASFYMESLRHLEQECVILVMLDTRGRFLADSEIFRGTVNASLISPREVFLTALSHRAVQIILVHNHPSGDAAPSTEDRVVTAEIAHAGRLLGIPLADHVIVGDHCFTSLLGTDAYLFDG